MDLQRNWWSYPMLFCSTHNSYQWNPWTFQINQTLRKMPAVKGDFNLLLFLSIQPFVCPICTHSPILNPSCALDVIMCKAKVAQWFLNVAATGHTQLPLAISETWQHKATVVTRRETKHSGNSISMLGACQQLSALCSMVDKLAVKMVLWRGLIAWVQG